MTFQENVANSYCGLLSETAFRCRNFDADFIVTDKSTEPAISMSTKKTLNTVEAVKLLQGFMFVVNEVWENFISHRDRTFSSKVWEGFTRLQDIELTMSTTKKLQVNGRSETFAVTLPVMLRPSIQTRQGS